MTEWVNAKYLGKMFHCNRRTIVNHAKFGRYSFPRATWFGHRLFWKMNDILRWKYKRIAAFKKPVRGMR